MELTPVRLAHGLCVSCILLQQEGFMQELVGRAAAVMQQANRTYLSYEDCGERTSTARGSSMI
jgi:hypothetical protein